MNGRIEQIGDCTLYLGDCREILPMFDTPVWRAGFGTIGVVATDPPYGHNRYPTDDATAVVAALKPFIGGVPTAVFGYPERLCEIVLAFGAAPLEWVTWWPSNTNGASRSNLLARESEHIAIWANDIDTRHIMRRRSSDKFGRRVTINRGLDPDHCRDGDVWRDPSPGVRSNSHLRHHINEKPVSVMEKLLGCWPAGIVLDPFMGSGTTGVACVKLGRKFIGVEIEERYFNIAVRRIEDEIANGVQTSLLEAV